MQRRPTFDVVATPQSAVGELRELWVGLERLLVAFVFCFFFHLIIRYSDQRNSENRHCFLIQFKGKNREANAFYMFREHVLRLRISHEITLFSG